MDDCIIATTERRLYYFAKFLTLISAGRSGLENSNDVFEKIDNHVVNTENIKCAIVDHKFHGPAYGKFDGCDLIIKCNFKNGNFRGPIEISWTNAYIFGREVTHTNTYIKGRFTSAGFTGKCVTKGRFAGEKHYINSNEIYKCGKVMCREPYIHTSELATIPLGDAVISYTEDRRVDFRGSWQKDHQGRDMCLPDEDIHVYKLCNSVDNKNKCYVKLFVPKEIRRTQLIPFSTWLIVEKALVVDIFDDKGNKYNKGISSFSCDVVEYIHNEWAISASYNDDINGLWSGILVHKYIDYCNQWKDFP